MNKTLLCLLILLILSSRYAHGQSATMSYPFAVGRIGCTSGTQQIHFYNYNGTTNTISNASGGLVGTCIPQLRIGTSGGSGGIQRFTSSVASVSFNPKDHNIYYFWTAYGTGNALTQGAPARTFAWKWPLGSCPTGTSPRLDTLRSFASDILGVAFDNNGNGYIIEFTNALPTVPPTYKGMIRSIDFATGVLGVADTLALTGGAKIYQQGSGDVVMTPSGQMFFIVDNKLFTPNYQVYTGSAANITCTYIDTVVNSATGNFVGLTYADGETVSAYSGGGCPFFETNMLTAATGNITKSGTVNSAADMATVVSGVGAAKKLVSVTQTGTPNQYDVIYDIYVKNYGNVDITNVQVTDDLTAINGAGNVSNIITSFVSNPAGLVLNGAFNGNSDKNLLNGTGTLPNYPVSNNNVTIRISCRLSNIQNGIVYNNSAIATAVGFNSQNLRDSSTNGTQPDLNTNDKPDDAGEGQPTPLLISVTPQTPPCASLSQTLYSQNFGSGTGLTTTIPIPTLPAGRLWPGNSGYVGTTTAPVATDRYTISDNAVNGDGSHWINLTDHTGGANGRMLLVNADALNSVFYRDTITVVCPNQQYSLLFYAAFIGNASYQTLCNGFGGFKYPNITMQVRDRVSGLVITQIATGDITGGAWNQYGMKFIMPTGFSSIIIELINNGQGGCGNDLALDDIQFGTCNALPTVSLSTVTAGCLGGNTTFTAALSDASVISGTIDYQWQVSTDSVAWSNIASATSSTYVIASTGAADINKFYRVIVAASGNIGTSGCQYFSPGYKLTAKVSSVAPTSVSQSRTAICSGDPVRLTVVGGSLGTNAQWKWYTGSCGGTLIGTGTNIIVNPVGATTYYVRAEGDCNTTACAQVTLTMNCDIDDDDDGIPDYVEGNGVDPSADNDSDGILNYLDTDYPGFVDINGDGVNDNFDADLDGVPNHLDLDSDNDGIPDVVESFGVDANGDGKIDNYTDTDADGFSQNVDGNNTGASGSGNGLGALDTDGDGIPNFLDLDSDNDGIPDVVEAYGTDNNHDGKTDSYTDANGNGFSDNVEGSSNALLKTGADGNGDGRADSYPNKNMDADSRANPYDLDSDGDGITDVKEANFTDADNNGRIDGAVNSKGWNAVVASSGVLNLPNTDGTGRTNVYDIDSDDDGIPDNIEGQTTAGYTLPSGLDTDSDGIDNSYDNFSGFGGNGIPPVDTDGDSAPDYRDSDTDGDGVLDIYEGNDYNNNGAADDGVVLTGADTDGDGLDNFFDLLSSARGTSAYMGNGGSVTGDATPGTKASVQHNAISGCPGQRDWRCVSFILNCNIITFKGALQNKTVQLDWTAVCDQDVDYFSVERSIDGSAFSYLDLVKVGHGADRRTTFHTADDISFIKSAMVYYRLKTVSSQAKISYSSTVSIPLDDNKVNGAQIVPNPVSGQLKVTATSLKKQKADLQIFNQNGKVMLTSSEDLVPGTNYLVFPQTENYPVGVYYLHIRMSDTIVTLKFDKVK